MSDTVYLEDKGAILSLKKKIDLKNCIDMVLIVILLFFISLSAFKTFNISLQSI